MKRIAFALLMLAAAAGFIALGGWQVERLAWKRALITQTQQRLAQAPVPAPSPKDWARIGSGDLYTRLKVRGRYLSGKDIYVLASTRYGRGYWVLSPLKADEGFVVFINRGFIASARRAEIKTPSKDVEITGLLRLSEPGGTFLQKNRPDENRWFSRDIQSMSSHMGLSAAAPYFIDEDARGGAPSIPIAGLTVVRFSDNHLQYALTWFGLALLSFTGLAFILRDWAKFSLRQNLTWWR